MIQGFGKDQISKGEKYRQTPLKIETRNRYSLLLEWNFTQVKKVPWIGISLSYWLSTKSQKTSISLWSAPPPTSFFENFNLIEIPSYTPSIPTFGSNSLIWMMTSIMVMIREGWEGREALKKKKIGEETETLLHNAIECKILVWDSHQVVEVY